MGEEVGEEGGEGRGGGGGGGGGMGKDEEADCKGSFTLQTELSRAEPDRTELNQAERVTIHIASRADPN